MLTLEQRTAIYSSYHYRDKRETPEAWADRLDLDLKREDNGKILWAICEDGTYVLLEHDPF